MPGVPTSTLDMDAIRTVLLDGWEYLQVPTLEEYSLVWKNSLYYGFLALQHLTLLLYLSIRPIVNGSYGILRFLWNHLVWKFLEKSVKQLGVLLQQFWKFQRSLSPKQVALELIIVIVFVLLYLLRRYIQKQAYVQRIQRWYKGKMRKITKVRKYVDCLILNIVPGDCIEQKESSFVASWWWPLSEPIATVLLYMV